MVSVLVITVAPFRWRHNAWCPITLMGRTTDATFAMLLRVRAQVNGNHNRVHASLKSSRGPRGMSVAGSP
jgi:hypothetical protein